MRFHGPIVRPPTDADSLFIEVTAGCSQNQCTFCNYYKQTPFFAAPLKQIEEDLKEAKSKVPHVRKIWASGGNPFCLSPEKQIPVWDLMRKYYPEARISTYAQINDIRHKTVEQIREIHEHGLDDILIGMESGDDEVLAAVHKGYKSRDIVEQTRKLDEAGMPYRMIYLGGLAGKGKLVQSARKSAAVLNQIHPYYLYVTTLAVLPGTKLYEQREEGTFVEAGETERLQEMRELISDLKNRLIIDTRTSTNSVQALVPLPEGKEEVLRFIDKRLSKMNDSAEEEYRIWRDQMRNV